MQRHDADPNPSADTRANAPAGNRTSATKPPPYVPPVIPMGLPHAVQFVTGSLLHMPGPFQLMADRMSRYANADGEVSIALEFLCKISDLGSKNTAKTYIDKLAAMDMLETLHGQGRQRQKEQHVPLPGRQTELEATPRGRAGYRPLAHPAGSPPGEREPQTAGPRSDRQIGAPDKRRCHQSPGSDRWTQDNRARQLRHSHSTERGPRHRSLQSDLW